MLSPVSAAWPKGRDVEYRNDIGESSEKLQVLESRIQDDGRIDTRLHSQTVEQYRANSREPGQLLSLVIIRRSWTMNSSHRRVAKYDISQEGLTSVVVNQGLEDFYRRTRPDVAGLHTFALAGEPDDSSNQDENFFGLVYDATLGLWARYDCKLKTWHGVYMISSTDIDFEQITRELMPFAYSKAFMCLLAARLTLEFLSMRSRDLPEQIARIERHSGHHFSVMRPEPATYAELSRLTADATATANLLSHYEIVICHLIDGLLQHLKHSRCHKSADPKSQNVYHKHLQNMLQRHKALAAYMRYLSQRAARQITATQHLVAEANASTNLAVAQDTHTIGLASRRDALSMKILTAVATTLLPGTFVATLFSMDMFDWFATSADKIVSKRFWIYWSVTLPLTFMTVGFWVVWEYWTAEKRRKRRENATLLGEVDKRSSV